MSVIPLFVQVRAERHVRGRLVKETFEDGREVSLEVPGLTVGEALRVKQFWMIIVSIGVQTEPTIGAQKGTTWRHDAGLMLGADFALALA